MTDQKILPCPFCGSAVDKLRTSGDERDGYADRVTYACRGCGCSRTTSGDTSKGGYADNSKVEAKALLLWNTRVTQEECKRCKYNYEQPQVDCALCNGSGLVTVPIKETI